jgi:hypothetical protein
VINVINASNPIFTAYVLNYIRDSIKLKPLKLGYVGVNGSPLTDMRVPRIIEVGLIPE